LEAYSEEFYDHIRAIPEYGNVMAILQGMAEEGNEEALTTIALINSIIPAKPPKGPPIGKPQVVPRPPKPEVLKKHIKKDGKK
jgi:hypothetical protein